MNCMKRLKGAKDSLTPLENLYSFAEQKNIAVFDARFSKTKKGACLCDDKYNNVLLDKLRIENAAEEALVLAEELGHIEEGGMYRLTKHLPIGRINRSAGEYKAKRWRVMRLLPENYLRKMIHKCSSMCELSEELGYPREFVNEAIQIYSRNGVEFDFPGKNDPC